MKLGKLEFVPINKQLYLVGEPTKASIQTNNLSGVLVAPIDPEVSDTAAFCETYNVNPEVCVNCVILEAKRANRTWYVACLVPAPIRADVNGIVRKHLDARKISFAPMEAATSLSKMAYGAISPLGLPPDWPILVESSVAKLEHAVIGSGVRQSKLLVPGSLLAALPNTTTMSLVKTN